MQGIKMGTKSSNPKSTVTRNSQNSSGNSSNDNNNNASSTSAKLKAKAVSHSGAAAGNHVQNPQPKTTLKNPTTQVKKNEDGHVYRAGASTSQKVVNRGTREEKIHQLNQDSPNKQLVSGNAAGQNSHSHSHSQHKKNSSKEAKDSSAVHKAKKSEGESTSQMLLDIEREKKMSQPSAKKNEKVAPKPDHTNPSNRPLRKETLTDTYHIVWDGFEESEEPLGQRCCICEVDLASEPNEEDAEDDDSDEDEDEGENAYAYENGLLPEVAVLECGHAFHDQCLLLATPEESSRDPPCFICASLS